MLKVPNFALRFLGKKIFRICEATKSYAPALYNKILQTVVKCSCGWNCMTLHSFFFHLSLCLVTKMNLLKKPLSSFNPRKQLFLCLQPWFGETTPPEIKQCFRIFFRLLTGDKEFCRKKMKSQLSHSSQFCSTCNVFGLAWVCRIN